MHPHTKAIYVRAHFFDINVGGYDEERQNFEVKKFSMFFIYKK